VLYAFPVFYLVAGRNKREEERNMLPPIAAFVIGLAVLVVLSIYPLKLHIFIGLIIAALVKRLKYTSRQGKL